jgi:hypothetical protein
MRARSCRRLQTRSPSGPAVVCAMTNDRSSPRLTVDVGMMRHKVPTAGGRARDGSAPSDSIAAGTWGRAFRLLDARALLG